MPTSPLPTKNPNLTSDLRDDHPISFAYTDAIAGTQGELVPPLALPPQIKLEGGTMLECTGCHDPHNNEFGNFLVLDNKLPGAPLCVACHKNNGWSGSAHNPLNNVSLASACMNCHYAHNAPGPVRLLHSSKEEDNCYLACHNASGAPSANVYSVLSFGMHRHPVDDASVTGIHDENEILPAQTYHVECVDCHNPHQANGTGAPLASPPNINGPLAGVRKDTQGNIATKEYEICFKCHSGLQASEFSGRSETRPNRQIAEADEMKRFDNLNNASFHPVMALRRGTGSSLLVPFDTTMLMIYCSDCHNSDQSRKAGGSGPSGPHGSNYEHILIAQYDMSPPSAPRQPYSASQYGLCFRCHNENYIMGSNSGFVNAGVNEHGAHVKGPRGIPCFACHDPHGISLASVSAVPASVQNNAHLINFNMDYASSSTVPIPSYTTLGSRSGSCKVSCHTSGGSTHTYAP
jgi:predicted CXXCH cytochrome family protein